MFKDLSLSFSIFALKTTVLPYVFSFVLIFFHFLCVVGAIASVYFTSSMNGKKRPS